MTRKRGDLYQREQTRRPAVADPVHARLQHGVRLHQLGRLAEADAAYQEAAKLAPRNPDIANLRGLIALQSGRADLALGYFDRAVKLAGNVADYHNNRGIALGRLGRIADADASFGRALSLRPRHPDANANRAKMLQQQGRPQEAIAHYQLAILSPRPMPEVLGGYGAALADLGRYAEAVELLRQAVALAPGNSSMKYSLARCLQGAGRSDDATRVYRTLLESDPGHVDALSNLAGLLADMRQFEEAESLARRAAEIAPLRAELHYNLGRLQQDGVQLAAAVQSYEAAIARRPDYADAFCNLGNVRLAIGEIAEAQAAFRQALTIDPAHGAAFSSLLMSLNYDETAEPAEVWAEHQRFGALKTGMARTSWHRSREAQRRLRIGYVSPDFRTHSCAYFIEPLLAAHDRQVVEVFCYSAVKKPDATTDKLRRVADQWRDIDALEDGAAAALVEEDAIDVLVDLAGHTAENRLGLFAMKPAPVQATWLGYPNTTGLSTIDWRLTDGWADPEGLTDHLHSERLMRIDGGFLCYQPSVHAPPLPLIPPVERRGHITFGSFNNISKIGPSVIGLWSEILRRVPSSRLVLKSRQMRDLAVRERYRGLFAAAGICADRLEFSAWLPSPSESLAAYGEIDVALDPFPYNGTTTTCEALWMGVPVITLSGDCHAGRVGVSLMRSAGVPELIASGPQDYIERAVGFAADAARLAEYRRDLRPRLSASALFDQRRFAREMETAYRAMWQDWCRRRSVSGST